MTEISVTVEKLLASFWLDSVKKITNSNSSLLSLRQFTKEKGIVASDAVLEKAANHLDGRMANGSVDMWVTALCFVAHPHSLWNFMLDAVAVADDYKDLAKIAAELAEHILAHYGSMIPVFEKHALRDQKFKRMLTGVWRHRMSDNVWIRLRAIQSDTPAPLSALIPLEHGVEYMSDSLSREDRENADKGPYRRDADGDWQKVTRHR